MSPAGADPPLHDDELQNVSDTALWVAAYRAEESERPDALFSDPYARRLAGRRGFELLDGLPHGRRYAWPMVVRTRVFDDFLGELADEGLDLVVNLAAGLDARPYRLPLSPDLRWVEVDLPAMIEAKTAALAGEAPACRLERVAVDLTDAAARRRLLDGLGADGQRGLVLTEGLLIYLSRAEVAELADELAAVRGLRWWILDLASPALLNWMAGTWGKAVHRAGAPFRFAPEEGPEFFAARGWRPRRILSSFHAAARLRRLPLPLRLLALLPQPRSFRPNRVWSGLCLFERA